MEILSNVNIQIKENEIHGIVGESGCGKSMTILSALGLLPSNCFITSGHILFKNQEITELSDKEWSRIRGGKIAYIPQNPQTSLNPTKKIGRQIAEAILLHEKVPAKELNQRVLELLKKVGITEPEQRINQYPFQLSGGMCQRILIACALACNPELLIADEPTTALDVTVQAQILDLLLKLKNEMHMSVILVTHDLGIVAQFCDTVTVMYAGQVIESNCTKGVFDYPKHPYTTGLLQSLIGRNFSASKLYSIPGTVPTPDKYPEGCRFCERCQYADGQCNVSIPELKKTGDALCACFHPYYNISFKKEAL